jgi:hypothetical protein
MKGILLIYRVLSDEPAPLISTLTAASSCIFIRLQLLWQGGVSHLVVSRHRTIRKLKEVKRQCFHYYRNANGEWVQWDIK